MDILRCPARMYSQTSLTRVTEPRLYRRATRAAGDSCVRSRRAPSPDMQKILPRDSSDYRKVYEKVVIEKVSHRNVAPTT
ncbi:unnamed protein product, partial [Brenthis ino]